MANSDKNIVITPNIGSTTDDPKIVFSGAGATSGPQNITLSVYPTNSGTLSFDGSAGQLFNITNSLSGTIFSVNDVSGIPSIEVLDTGLVKVAEYSGNVLLGTSTDNGTNKLQVAGNISSSGTITATTFSGSLTGNASTATTLATARTIGGVSFNGSANINLPGVNITGTQNTSGSAATLTTGRTIALTGDVTYTSGAFNGSANVTGVATLASVGTAGTYTKVTTDAKGRVTSGTTLADTDIPNLNASKITAGTIDAARLPSYVDDVIEGANLAAFPATGETGKIYVALDTNKTYRWSGSAYIFITSGAVDSVAGKTGVVTLVKADVGLGSVDNTADSAKNVATAATLTTARTINGVSFNGSANITVADSTKLPLTGGTLSGKLNSQGGDSARLFESLNSSASNSVQFYIDHNLGATNIGNARGVLNLVSSGALTIGGSVALTAGNYNTYSPTLTGTGASGNWGINVTGSAATLTTARTIGLAGDVTGSVSFNGSANVSITAAVVDDSHAHSFNNLLNKTSGTGTYTTSGDYRAPIFYDSNNTEYYVDPTSSSILNTLYLRNSSNTNILLGTASTYGYSSAYRTLVLGNQAYTTVCIGVDPVSNTSPSFNGGGSGVEVMFKNGVNFITPNAGNNSYHTPLTLADGYASSTGSFRAPIFYDSNDTAFYADPASTSRFSGLTVTGTTTFASGSYVAANGDVYARRNSGTTGVYYFADGGSKYLYWDGGEYIFGNAGVVTGSSFRSSTDARGPIFYDSNDTAYYVDPNSTTNLNLIQANTYRQNASGVPRVNLGDPTITEMALFDGQFNNKTEFFPPANVICETSTNGTTWTTYSVSDAQKKLLVGGDSGASISIPNGTAYFRVRFINRGDYVYLNALYAYHTSGGHSTQVQIYKKDFGSTTWVQHTSSTASVGSWPGHIYLPFNTIAYHPGTYVDEIAVVFIPTWNNPTWSGQNITLHQMQIWGGYPAGKRNIYSVDSDKNVTFPSDVRATLFYDSNNTAFYYDGAGTTNINALYGNGKAIFATADSYLRINEGAGFSNGIWMSNSNFGGGSGTLHLGSAGDPAFSRIRIIGGTYNGSTVITLNGADGTIHANKTAANNTPAIQVRGGNPGYPRIQTYGLDADAAAWMGLGTDMGGGPYEHSVYFPNGSGSGRLSIGDYNGTTYNPRLWVYTTYTQINNSTRSPIFYDSDNTGYYIDPATDTRLGGTLLVGPTGSGAYTRFGSGAGDTTHATVAASNGNLHIDSQAGYDLYLNWYSARPVWSEGGAYFPIYYDRTNSAYYVDPASTTSLRTAGDWRSDSGSWTGEFNGKIQYHANNWYFQSAGEWNFRRADAQHAFSVTQAGIAIAAQDMRAPIFYDNNNTAYYVDSAATSYINALNIGPTASGSSYLNINGYNAYGGTGYHGFLTIRNTYGSATNPQQYWRLNAAGGFEIVNNAYNAVLFTLTQGGDFTAAGNVTAYSDRKLKANFEPIENAVSKVLQLNGVTFTRIDKEDATIRYAGLIAQDVEVALPEAVQSNETMSYGEVKSVDYNGTIALLVEAIKELKAEIETLKSTAQK